MEKFETLTGIAAPLPIQNVDTDMIIPKQFLKTIKRTGLSEGLFFEMRYEVDGTKIEDFVLHQAPYTEAKIIVSGENFGCGSSREHAPWALLDFGIRCVIAPSFADIFYNNCFKNGILPIRLTQEEVDIVMEQAANGQEVTINLEEQHIEMGHASAINFEVEAFRKHCLTNGLDDIGLTMQKTDAIDEFETGNREQTPWLYAG